MSAISCAALVVAALSSGCGGGHEVNATSTGARSQSSVTLSATSTTTRTATQPVAGAYWSYEKLVGRLAGRAIALARGTVHLQSALLECNGDGALLRTGTTRRWSRYTCTQTLFENGVDRDVTFGVTILSPTQLSITSPRYGPD